jgi:2-polyprenyl-3-methyl-5-hydroxy-6-metoxy-1,4-benzoquinol methylase
VSLEDVLKAVHVTDEVALRHYRSWFGVERRQGEYFASILLDNLPFELDLAIRGDRLTMLDVGCSCGHLVKRLRTRYPFSPAEGVDVERVRIDAARHYYPDCIFHLGDVASLDANYDCIFSSNVLEHFPAPIDILEQVLAPHARRFVITLVPYRETDLIEGHLFKFDDASFPARFGDLELIHKKVIDCRLDGADCWPGFQLLTVYERA